MESIRLDKFLADSSGFSRREVRALIRSGAVTVDGAAVRSPEHRISVSAAVEAAGRRIVYRRYIYLMLNKPAGYLSATRDEREKVVTDLVPECWRHFKVFPVGRLDKDTEGLLLLTNDGRFDHAVMSPRREITKSYLALLAAPAVPEDVEIFRSGMDLGDFTAKPAVLEITDDPRLVRVVISEGKYHQVKRMCERVGKPVLRLRREAIGGLRLDDSLAPGAMRELSEADFAALGVERPAEG